MPAGTQRSCQSSNANCVLIPQGVGQHSFKATQPGYHYTTDQGESRIRGSTTPALVSYLHSLVPRRDEVATGGQ